MEVTRNVAMLKLPVEEYIILAKADAIIRHIDNGFSEEEYLSDDVLSELHHKDISNCLNTLKFFLRGRAVSGGGEGIFYIEKEKINESIN